MGLELKDHLFSGVEDRSSRHVQDHLRLVGGILLLGVAAVVVCCSVSEELKVRPEGLAISQDQAKLFRVYG